MNKPADEQLNGQMDDSMNGLMNEGMDDRMDDRMNDRMDARMDTLQKYVLELPLHNEVFFAMVGATAHAVAVSEKYWQAQGLNGARIRVLVEIAKQGGAILPSLLAERIGVTKANISLLLTPLEKDGYISRADHAKDGRKTVISITEAGRALLSEQLPGNRNAVASVMKRLDETELHQLLGLLNKLSEHTREK
ncbi:MarR family winged helix-turn-helix transcriptional regulator [Paenibacillus sp. IHB B 3415]|uniref:MarR family winged helix-turn-helix transcriptional regulator n=1 Tax=Paenibacillus sp. IHB B 3415 TaxID=867080 RepID=UPI001F37F84F|nr:MarR family transcriptional regulator [Paenibacillus sp. IHB B 3415]